MDFEDQLQHSINGTSNATSHTFDQDSGSALDDYDLLSNPHSGIPHNSIKTRQDNWLKNQDALLTSGTHLADWALPYISPQLFNNFQRVPPPPPVYESGFVESPTRDSPPFSYYASSLFPSSNEINTTVYPSKPFAASNPSSFTPRDSWDPTLQQPYAPFNAEKSTSQPPTYLLNSSVILHHPSPKRGYTLPNLDGPASFYDDRNVLLDDPSCSSINNSAISATGDDLIFTSLGTPSIGQYSPVERLQPQQQLQQQQQLHHQSVQYQSRPQQVNDSHQPQKDQSLKTSIPPYHHTAFPSTTETKTEPAMMTTQPAVVAAPLYNNHSQPSISIRTFNLSPTMASSTIGKRRKHKASRSEPVWSAVPPSSTVSSSPNSLSCTGFRNTMTPTSTQGLSIFNTSHIGADRSWRPDPDPNAPVEPDVPYLTFLKRLRSTPAGRVSYGHVTEEAARQWQHMSQSDRTTLENDYTVARKKYVEQMKIYVRTPACTSYLRCLTDHSAGHFVNPYKEFMDDSDEAITTNHHHYHHLPKQESNSDDEKGMEELEGHYYENKEEGGGGEGGKRKRSLSSTPFHTLNSDRRKKPKADPNAPVKPYSAYVKFGREIRHRLQEENQSFSDISKIIGASWRDLDPKKKEHLARQADESKARYQIAMKKYQSTTDHQNHQRYVRHFKVPKQAA